MNKLKKMAFRVSKFLKYLNVSFLTSKLKTVESVAAVQVIAECLSEEEIAGLKEMFKMIDTDNSGQITFEELKVGLKKFGDNLKESEILDLMHAVSLE